MPQSPHLCRPAGPVQSRDNTLATLEYARRYLDLVHVARRLLVARCVAARRAHLLVRLAVLARLVGRRLRCEACDIIWPKLARRSSLCSPRSLCLTFDLGLVTLWLAHHERRRLAVERVRWVRVAQQLRQEHLEDVEHVVHGRPRLVDDVEADTTRPAVCQSCVGSCRCKTCISSILGWKMRFTKPMLGDLYGYWSGSSTWIFQRPPAKGAAAGVSRRRICLPRPPLRHSLSSGPLKRT